MHLTRDMLCGALCAVGVLMHAPAGAQQLEYTSVAASALERDPGITFDPGSVLVKFAGAADESAVAKAVASVEGRIIRRYSIVPGLVHVAIGVPVGDAIAALEATAGIEFAEPDFVVRPQEAIPSDEKFGLQWGMRNIGQTVNGDPGTHGADLRAPRAWTICVGESHQVIAVIDAGTLVSHPDLAANIWTNPGEIPDNGIDDDANGYIDDVHGWDFFSNDNDPSDPGHGTHTAGTIGAVGNNGIGVAGMSWECRLMPLRFIGPLGGYISGAVSSLEYALSQGVRISNNSWGTTSFSHALFEAVGAACDREHLFVAAAGNLGRNTDVQPFFPASFTHANVLSVAAIDNDDARPSFSNYGAVSVDLAAPGVAILSTDGTEYGYRNGTSMACAHVTGLAGMFIVDFPDWTCLQIKNRLIETARPVEAMAGRCVAGGVLDAGAALDIAPPPVNEAPVVHILTPSVGTVLDAGELVVLTAEASDAEDGDVADSIVWNSSLQGVIGSGGSIATDTLVVGKHTITATAFDGAGLWTRTAISLIVRPVEVPDAPAAIRATRQAPGARIEWIDSSSNETGFEVMRERRSNGAWIEGAIIGTAGADSTRLHDPSADQGTYRYAVRAVRGTARSAWTGWTVITIP